MVERAEFDILAHKCMTTRFPGLVQALQENMAGLD